MKNKKNIVSILLTIVITLFLPMTSIFQANIGYCINNEEETYLNSFSNICLSPGENETMLNFSWYSKCSSEVAQIKIWEKDKEEVIYKGKSVALDNGFISNKVTVKNLKSNTKYFYSYECDGNWSKPLEYKTNDFNNYSFLFVADPQIGSSSKEMNSYEEGIKKDSYNWNQVIKKSLNKSDNLSFIISGGDLTNTKEDVSDVLQTYISNLEYSGFLSPVYLRSIPITSAIGNHDKDNTNFYNHFNITTLTNLGKGVAGSDYYFTYGNTLYLFINTNNLNICEHERFIEDVVAKNKDIKWKIAVFHHDIYGGGRHKDDEDIKILRENLPAILESNKIDLVLCGHDHIYSRTYPIKDNKKIMKSSIRKLENSDEKVETINKNKGVVYITGSSCTGSKFYKQREIKNKYIKKIYNKDIPTYTIISTDSTSMSIVTYEVDNDKPIDNKIIIQK